MDLAGSTEHTHPCSLDKSESSSTFRDRRVSPYGGRPGHTGRRGILLLFLGLTFACVAGTIGTLVRLMPFGRRMRWENRREGDLNPNLVGGASHSHQHQIPSPSPTSSWQWARGSGCPSTPRSHVLGRSHASPASGRACSSTDAAMPRRAGADAALPRPRRQPAPPAARPAGHHLGGRRRRPPAWTRDAAKPAHHATRSGRCRRTAGRRGEIARAPRVFYGQKMSPLEAAVFLPRFQFFPLSRGYSGRFLPRDRSEAAGINFLFRRDHSVLIFAWYYR
jgi:hypothetical protein